MDWHELANGLEMEWRRLGDVELTETSSLSLQTSGELIEQASQRERTTRPVVDAAVRAFVRGWPWPELSDDEKFFLKMRLHYAWRLADSFVPLKARETSKAILPGSMSENARSILEWLLVDLWPSLSFPIWLESRVQYYVGLSGGELTTGPVFQGAESMASFELRP